ncbi:PAS domain S-box protein [Niveispirillum sp.]|uniref:PAS domain S-box protein n=1 Tax=Niveispirillum sp. TaxID=1917217 RepID=UPI001B7800EE|nr:PAS domain S-box protein [Niveispirillum sp.]MBP7339302.1 PAS domain S-box protein [Niveispirillum sp.]
MADKVAAALVDRVGGGLILVDPAQRVRLWNRWMAQATPLPVENLLGRCLWDLFPGLRNTRLGVAVDEALTTGTSSFLTHNLNARLLPLFKPDGRQLLYDTSVQPFDMEGERWCFIQLDDQTANIERERALRERGEARYRAVVDAAPEVIVTTDSAGVIQWINGAVTRHFGYEPQDVVGHPIALLLENAGADLWPRGQSERAGEGGIPLEATGRRKDGSTFDLEISIGRWTSEQRLFRTGILRDVTERKRVDAELRHLNATLEARVEERTAALRAEAAQRARVEETLLQSQKMEAVGQLTGGMAHDFNNLLQALQACLQMVGRRTKGMPEVQPLLDAGRQAVDRGASLVRQLMSFARKQALIAEPFDVRERLLGMRVILDRALRADIRLQMDIHADTWNILGDPTQFELAVLNLVVNARDAISADGMVVVSAGNRTLDGTDAKGLRGEYVEISVSDNGVGMSPEISSRIFEPFFTTKSVGKGTGLGLAQVYGFCEQSGGTVTVVSTPGSGTHISLFLPRSIAAMGEDSARISQPAKGEGAVVLLVEDDPIVLPVVKAALEDLDYVVHHASTGDEALRRLTEGEAVDILFTDLVMPGHTSGIALAHQARKLRPDLPIVLTTGYSSELSRESEFRLLAKPYQVEDIAAMFEAELKRRQRSN